MKQLINIIKRYFVSGVLVVVPLILTYIVLKFLFESVDGILHPLIEKLFGYYVYGMGVVVTLLLILMAGILTRNFFGAKLYRLWDKFLNKVPLIRPIYSAAKQLLEAVAAPSMDSFKEVVLVEYPRQGVYAVGFLTNRLKIKKGDETSSHVSVFVPSTPTPISGMVVLFDASEVTLLNLTIEEGIKFLVSGGVASPEILETKI